MRIKKLCVGIPNLGSIRTNTVECLVGVLFTTGCDFHLVMPYGCYIDENRNIAAKEALEIGASHLMFIDSDMVFPDNGIATLASRDKRVIGVNYNLRKLPLQRAWIIPGEDTRTSPFKCDALPTGFMLIQTDVFKELSTPWFLCEYAHEKGEGEDIYFCRKARAKGIDVWCDPTFKVHHIGDYLY